MNYSAEQYGKALEKINNIVSTNSDYKLILQSVCELLSSEFKICVVIKDSENYYFNNKSDKSFKDVNSVNFYRKLADFDIGDENAGVINLEFWEINCELVEDSTDENAIYYSVDNVINPIFMHSLRVILNLIIKNLIFNQTEDAKKRKDDVKNALDKLSFSELNAVVNIFCNFETNNETIVASKIAQKHDLTRSSIVNAIRKLESAKIIESYSLGVKGTHIKIINSYFVEEIKKLK